MSELTLATTVSYATTLSGLVIPVTWTKVWWTLKASVNEADSAAWLQLVVTNPPVATDGTLYVMGAAATVSQQVLGGLTVHQATGTLDIALDETLTALLSSGAGLVWDAKTKESGGAVTILTGGTATIARTVTWAT